MTRSVVALFTLLLLTSCGDPSDSNESNQQEDGEQEPASKIFIESQHEKSERFAVLESDGSSGWLYLTRPGIKKPHRHAFAFSEIEPVKKFDVDAVKDGSPPIISRDMASSSAVLKAPAESDLEIVWSADGNSVAAHYRGEPRAMIVAGKPGGYTVAVSESCLIGEPFDEDLYHATFSAGSE